MKTPTIGVLHLDRAYPLLPGNVAHPRTFSFPTEHRVIPGLSAPPVPPIVQEGRLSASVQKVIDAVKELEEKGVAAIVLSCGFFAACHDVVASHSGVPVISSPLLLLPFLLQMLPAERRIAVLSLYPAQLTCDHFSSVGVHVPARRIVVQGFPSDFAFRRLIEDGDLAEVACWRAEVVSAAVNLRQQHPDIQDVLIECSDLPTFSADIQSATRLRVYDYAGLIELMYRALVAPSYVE